MKNYYAILGISPNETEAGIRAAYRDAVRRTHPDHAGPQAAPAFQEIVEAHSVLSDPDRRRQHNEDLRLYERDRIPPEPVDRSEFVETRAWPPSFGTLADRFLRNFTGHQVPYVERREEPSIEVILTPEEAARGGILFLDLPVRQVCGACGGTGGDWIFLCLHCAGEGTISGMKSIQVPIPESIRLGRTRQARLETRGFEFWLRVSNEQFD
jgi:DnaJ-class molecular chaperone